MPLQGLYTAAQTRELDRLAIEEAGIPGIILMSRAGCAAFDHLLETWPECAGLHIFCGTGNNGGDGSVMAALARSRGMSAVIHQVGDAARISGDALRARQRAEAEGVEIRPFAPADVPIDGVVVDALLGTGLSGDVRPEYRQAIEAINASGLPVLAVDIPSGLCSDTGRVLGCAVRAGQTITFIGAKQGLFTGAAPVYCGEIVFDDLDVPADVYASVNPAARLLDIDHCLEFLPPRAADAHKGSYGHVAVMGGETGFGGAALMCAEAAARSGAGLVSAATRPAHVPAFVSRRPEIMVRGVDHANELGDFLARATVLAVGPGLGRTPWSEQMLHCALASGLPAVLDADALNLLPQVDRGSGGAGRDWILTPHPGEAARLLDCLTAEVQADRFQAARALQARFGGVVILKGAGTLVCSESHVYVSQDGNPGMASGGMGDVLTGVLAGLLAQGLSLEDAACLGVCLHGCAADLAAEDGMAGLLATDLLPWVRALLDG